MAANFDEIEIRRLSSADYNEVYALMMTAFLPDEPMNRAVGLSVRDSHELFCEFIDDALRDGISFVAINSKKRIVGFRLNEIMQRDSMAHPPIPIQYPQRMMFLVNLLGELSSGFFDLVPESMKKVLKLLVIAVDRDFRGAGVARKLMDATIKLAREENFDAILTTATAIRTQTLFTHMGFETLRVIQYDGYTASNGELIFQKIAENEKEARLMVLKL